MDFVDYMLGREVNLDVLKKIAKGNHNPDDIAAKILDYGILHHYLALSARCPSEGGRRDEDYPAANIDLNVVEFLIDLAPDAVNKADGLYCHHPYGSGAYPLHLACFNADCPVSVIKLLVEKNPLALRQTWKEPYSLPLHCYLARACIHPSWGYEDEDMRYFEEIPAFPSGDLDYHVVKLLVDAYPEALTYNISDKSARSALHILCEGFNVSMELMQLLVDKDGVVLKLDGKKSPLWTLLHSPFTSPFPADVFCYLFHHNPSALEMEEQKPSRRHYYGIGEESSLQIACLNPNITVEIIEMIVNLCPNMVEVEDRTLEEQSAIDILKILTDAYPKSVKERTWKQNHCPSCLSIVGVGKKLPITLAEESMSFGFCKTLLSEHARLSKTRMANILQMACVLNCSLDMIQKLVQDDRTLLTAKDEEHCIALHTAAKYQSLEVVKFLVEEDENTLTILDKKMEIALHKACRADNLDVVKYLISKNATTLRMGNHSKELPLHVATKYASVEIVQHLVEADESTLILPNNKMELALHTACRVDNLDLVKYLVMKNDSTLLIGNHCHKLPIHLAAKYSSVGVLQFLVEANESSLTMPDRSKEVALFKACRSGKLDIVKYLSMKNDSTLTKENYRHELPIHIAAKIHSVEMVKFLVESNEHTLTMPDVSIEVALHKACRVGNLKAVQYMMHKYMGTLAIANHSNELPAHILCLALGKCENDKMMKHIETIFMMLRAYPEAIVLY
ncbi:hypothetical protein ACHAW6_007949 [Cyclotella cf. meneghiniana]